MIEQAKSSVDSRGPVCPDCGYGLRTLTIGCTCGWMPPKSETVEQADVYAARHGWGKALAERDAARVECDRLRAENQQARALCDSFHEAETRWIKKTADLQAECDSLRAELAATKVNIDSLERDRNEYAHGMESEAARKREMYGQAARLVSERDTARDECDQLRAKLAAATSPDAKSPLTGPGLTGSETKELDAAIDIYAAAPAGLKAIEARQAIHAVADRIKFTAGQAAGAGAAEPLTFGEWMNEFAESIDAHQRARLTFAAAARCCARRGAMRCRHVIPPLSDAEVERLADVARTVHSLPSKIRPGLDVVDMPGVVRAIAAQITAPWRGPLTDAEWSELRHMFLSEQVRAKIDALLTGEKEKSDEGDNLP